MRIKTIYKFEDYYPANFLTIKNAPQKIYAEGNYTLLNELAISIVGSRKCSRYGEKMSRKFAKEVSSLGIITVSGLAVGVDKIVHEETLANRGKTIAVLPCGLKNIYPQENKELYEKIIEKGGVVISEYEPDVIADSKKFLSRNRLVSALGECLIVTEAWFRSGTSVTARYAREQGKKVFCVPSSLDNKCGIGTNKMIKNGASLLTGISDIFEEVKNERMEKYIEKYKQLKSTENIFKNVPENCENLYNAIGEQPTSIDYIFSKLKEPIGEISYKLTILELEGLIDKIEGGFYQKNYI